MAIERATNIEILTVKEVAKYLKRSPGAVRNLVLRHKLPARKVLGRLVFIKSEINSIIENSKKI